MAESLADLCATVDALVDDQASDWDRAGILPEEVLRKLGSGGLLCPEVPARYRGLGRSSADGGEFTAHVGSRCSSLRMASFGSGRRLSVAYASSLFIML